MSEEYTPLVDYPDYTQEFAISAVLVDMIPVSIKAQTIDKIRIDIVAQSIGNIQVDIAAQTVGNISVDIAAQSVGNLAVDIKAATATVNVNIAGQVGNVAVDIAAQSLSTIAISINAADVTGNIPIDIAAQTLTNVSVDIAAQTVGNLAVDIAAQTLSTLKIDIAAQTLSQVDVNIAASAVTLNVNVTGSTATVDVNISAQTVNLNVKTAAGEKVDTIRLPDVESSASSGTVSVPSGTETSVLSLSGKGKVKWIALRASHPDVEFLFYVDGNMLNRYAILAETYFTPYGLSFEGFNAHTPMIQLLRYNVDGECFVTMQIPFEFTTSFEIRAYQTTGSAQSVNAGVIYNRVS